MRIKWEPAIYEHKAALVGRTPAEVANSAELLTEAVLKEYEVYAADYVTVGLDVYNVEAEALGAKIAEAVGNECPELAGKLFDLEQLPEQLVLPDIPGTGRFGLLLQAGKTVQGKIGCRTKVRVAASGPVTMAAKLAGTEELIMSLCLRDGNAERLLEFTADIAARWCSCIRENGLDAIVFDSMAAPPIFSPDMFAEFAMPLHRRLMGILEKSGQVERELVIGGNTVPIAALLPQTGANILLCDYAADAAEFKSALGDDSNLKIRRNINPALLHGFNAELKSKNTAAECRGYNKSTSVAAALCCRVPSSKDAIRYDMKELAEKFSSELLLFKNPIAGTGILPFDFDPERLLAFNGSVRKGI